MLGIRPRALATLPLLLFAACTVPSGRAGGVHCEVVVPPGAVEPLARRLAARANEIAIEVGELLELPPLEGVTVWFSETQYVNGVPYILGTAYRGPENQPMICLGLINLDGPRLTDSSLAHELTHLHLDEFPDLPYLVEEGLAYCTGWHFLSPGSLEHQLIVNQARGIVLPPELLEIDFETYGRSSEKRQAEMIDAGVEFVRRVGFENLLARLREGRASTDEIRELWDAVAVPEPR